MLMFTVTQFAVIGVLAAYLIARLIKTFVIPRSLRTTGAACGRCGYAYRGEPRCPECGGQINHVGVLTPRLLMTTGPGPITAAVCIGLLVLMTGFIGQAIGRAIQSSLAPSADGSFFGPAYRLTEGSLRYVFRDERPTLDRQGSEKVPDVELTIFMQLIQPQNTDWVSRAYEGEIMLLLNTPGQKIAISPSGPARLADQSPGLPHIRINAEARITRVFNAGGQQTAAFTSIDPDALEELAKLSGLATGHHLVDSSINAAGKVLPNIDFALRAGGNIPWNSSYLGTVDGAVSMTSSGGGISIYPAPFSLRPPHPLWITLWPYVWWLSLMGAGAWLFHSILRRRRALMAEPAAR